MSAEGPARGRAGRRSRLYRIAATALVTAGLTVIADVGVTLAWGEPVSALLAWNEQKQAEEDLAELEARYPGDLAPRRVPGFAEQLASSAEAGEAIGRIEIDSVGLDRVVVQGTGTDELRKGPGHYPESPLPGSGGTTAIAGHRTTYGAPFRNIDDVERGDEIVLRMPYGRFTYGFVEQRIVDPDQVEVVRDTGFESLVLTSCNPLYSAAQRIVVFARLLEMQPGPPGDLGPAISAREARPAGARGQSPVLGFN